jgi:hypothetical protein
MFPVAAFMAMFDSMWRVQRRREEEEQEAARKKKRRGWEPPVVACRPTPGAPRHLSPLPDDAPGNVPGDPFMTYDRDTDPTLAGGNGGYGREPMPPDATLEQRVEMWKRAFEVKRDENIALRMRIDELKLRIAELEAWVAAAKAYWSDLDCGKFKADMKVGGTDAIG